MSRLHPAPQQRRLADQRRHRRTQLVGHIGDETALPGLAASRSDILACRFSAMRLNEDPSTPELVGSFRQTDVEVAAGHDGRRSCSALPTGRNSPPATQ